MAMIPQWLIEKKRDGGELSASEIGSLIHAYSDGILPDYQMAAFAMAVYFKGMTSEETAALTDAMMRSGEVIDFSDSPRPTADKHSTGGIGDKISLILAPLAAAAGLSVPMISGRGLGITGGTLDKLESIEGYNTALSVEDFKRIVSNVGCSIIGQTENLAPADRKLYALRDVTATVPSIPLIVASIMSKKLAEGAETLVFDVKFGRGAFMKSRDEATRLADGLMRVGRLLGRKVSHILTDMNLPHGQTIGNALEVAEAVDVLRGQGPDDVRDLTVRLAAEMIAASGLRPKSGELTQTLKTLLDNGAALDKFAEMIRAHGAKEACVQNVSLLPQADVIHNIKANRSGIVTDIDAEKLGRAAILLGAGRRKTDDKIDHAAGISHIRRVNETIRAGETLCRVHFSAGLDASEASRLAAFAFTIS